MFYYRCHYGRLWFHQLQFCSVVCILYSVRASLCCIALLYQKGSHWPQNSCNLRKAKISWGGEVWGIWRGNTYGEGACFYGSATPLRCFTLGGWEKIVVDATSGRLWIPLFLEILITDCCICGSPSWLRLWTRSHSSSWSATHWTGQPSSESMNRNV